MARSDVRTVLGVALLLAPVALLDMACSRPPEQQMLNQFFRAARSRDNTTAALMSAVPLDPRTQGAVESFDIVSVTPEQRAPLDLQTFVDAAETARATEAEFQRQKKVYSDANLKTIEEILKLERDPDAKLTKEQAAVKPVWDQWRADTAMHVKNLSTARAALAAATAPVETSLDQPGQPAFDIGTFQGDRVTKDVSITARFRSPDGQTSEKNLVVTMARIVGTQAGTQREGKWIITRIAGL
ncbi:MAG: hypothetical protein OEW19_17995 [Acidobacteriota bacterium]|nr:hypothetical protein [Acidobacteriota bacterium]